MIERYEDEVINSYWCDTRKYAIWYRIEQAIAESNATNIGEETYEWKLISFNESDIAEIKRIEQDTKHDVAAFIQFICEENPKNARFIHSSLTSSDLVDTFNSFAIKHSSIYIYENLKHLSDIIKDLMYKNLNVKMLGRTHGQHASVITLGHKLEVYGRQLEKLESKFKESENLVGYKLAGPVGMGSNINESDAWMLDGALNMGRLYQCGSTQVIPRYYYYDVMSNLLGLSMVLSSIATDLRLLNQTEIGEFVIKNAPMQWGSSSMPHKINPILLEQVCGMSRLVKGYFNAFIDNMILWNERDISNSCVERIVFPDIFHILASQIKALTRVLVVGHFDLNKIKTNLMEARIDIMSNQLVQIMLSKEDIPYTEAIKKVKALLEKYSGMRAKEVISDTIKTSGEIDALKDLGVIE